MGVAVKDILAKIKQREEAEREKQQQARKKHLETIREQYQDLLNKPIGTEHYVEIISIPKLSTPYYVAAIEIPYGDGEETYWEDMGCPIDRSKRPLAYLTHSHNVSFYNGDEMPWRHLSLNVMTKKTVDTIDTMSAGSPEELISLVTSYFNPMPTDLEIVVVSHSAAIKFMEV
jgi:hypothetical protein